MKMNWQNIIARIVPGHRVASGQKNDPRFPGGTLNMQAPHFRALGLDLSVFHPGTLNASIAPARYEVVQPKFTFRRVQWHPVEPAEDFSFFDVRLSRSHGAWFDGLIYYPHPETKPEHFQSPDVLELLMPPINDLHYGDEVRLEIPAGQMRIAHAATPDSCADQ